MAKKKVSKEKKAIKEKVSNKQPGTQEDYEKKRKDGVFIPLHKRVPTTPAYLKVSKAEFVKREEARKGKDAKAKKFRDDLDKEDDVDENKKD